MYILDQVRALENEMVLRLKKQGLDVTPKILIVSSFFILPVLSLASSDGLLKEKETLTIINYISFYYVDKVTRLIPDAKGTSCNQRLERISGTQHTYILRVPFRNENGILKKWISRFDVWPYLEKFAEASILGSYLANKSCADFQLYSFNEKSSEEVPVWLSLVTCMPQCNCIICDIISKE